MVRIISAFLVMGHEYSEREMLLSIKCFQTQPKSKGRNNPYVSVCLVTISVLIILKTAKHLCLIMSRGLTVSVQIVAESSYHHLHLLSRAQSVNLLRILVRLCMLLSQLLSIPEMHFI